MPGESAGRVPPGASRGRSRLRGRPVRPYAPAMAKTTEPGTRKQSLPQRWLYVLAAGIMISFVVAVLNAWILLVEIRR